MKILHTEKGPGQVHLRVHPGKVPRLDRDGKEFVPDSVSIRFKPVEGGWEVHQISVGGPSGITDPPSLSRCYVKWGAEPTEPAWLVKLVDRVRP